MIQRFRCQACAGEYDEMQRDGTAYAHACGPLPATKDEPEIERPDKRDENPLIDRGGKVLGIKSEGAGVTCLTASQIEEPKWISELYKRVAAEEEKNGAS